MGETIDSNQGVLSSKSTVVDYGQGIFVITYMLVLSSNCRALKDLIK